MTEKTVDLSRFETLIEAQEVGIDVALVDELGNEIGMKIGVVGPDSKRARAAVKAVAAEFAAKAEERGSLAPSEDEDDERMAAYLAKVTTHWTPDPAIGGKAVKHSEENARNFFLKFRMFAEQVQARAVRRSPFAKSSSSASVS